MENFVITVGLLTFLINGTKKSVLCKVLERRVNSIYSWSELAIIFYNNKGGNKPCIAPSVI